MRSLLPLRGALVVRCAVSLAFAGYLIVAKPDSNPLLARAFIPFGVADGILAFLIAALVLAVRWHPGVAMVAAVDGLIRIAAALTLALGPGTPYFSLTVVLYVGVLATLSFSLGVLELGEARRLRSQIGRNPISIALVVAGLATIAIAIFAFVALPQAETSRRLLIVAALLEAVALLVAAVGMRRRVSVP